MAFSLYQSQFLVVNTYIIILSSDYQIQVSSVSEIRFESSYMAHTLVSAKLFMHRVATESFPVLISFEHSFHLK